MKYYSKKLGRFLCKELFNLLGNRRLSDTGVLYVEFTMDQGRKMTCKAIPIQIFFFFLPF